MTAKPIISGKAYSMFSPHQTLGDITKNIFNIGIFMKMLKSCSLHELFEGDEEYTIFAPRDKYFSEIQTEALELLLKNPILRYQLMKTHIVKGRYSLSHMKEPQSIKTLHGIPLQLKNVDRMYIEINDNVKIVDMDIEGKNGIIHIVDKLIIPEKIFFE